MHPEHHQQPPFIPSQVAQHSRLKSLPANVATVFTSGKGVQFFNSGEPGSLCQQSDADGPEACEVRKGRFPRTVPPRAGLIYTNAT